MDNYTFDTPFILPNLVLNNSLDKLQKSLESSSSYDWLIEDEDRVRTTLNELLAQKAVFVLAEPGQGKTRLMKELYNKSNRDKLFVSVKSIRSEPLVDFMKRKGAKGKLGSLFIDGLDEVSPRYISYVIDDIVDYILQNPNTQVFISCRIHYFLKYSQIFLSIPSAQYLQIRALDRAQSDAFMSKSGVPNHTATLLRKSLNFGYDRKSVLQNPRYLEMVIKQVKQGHSDPESLNRSSLFDAFINGALLLEDTKSGRQLSLYKRRFLESLALSMEIAQINVILENDLLTFIDQFKSDLKLTLINQSDIEDIYEHSLIKKTNDEISFENVEVQEYLAAVAITRLSTPSRRVFELAIEKNLREVLPSWVNTLSFIIDEHPGIARNIVDLNLNRLELSPGIEGLVTSATSKKILNEDKDYIFDYVWQKHIGNNTHIPFETSIGLANYLSATKINSIVTALKQIPYKPKNITKEVNLIRLAGDCLELKKFDDNDLVAVIKKLTNLSLNSSSAVIIHNALNALKGSEQPKLLAKLAILADHDDQLVLSSIESLAYDIDKNSDVAIDIYIKGLKKNDLYVSRRGLEEIDSYEPINYLINCLSKDVELIKAIIDHDRVFSKEESLFVKSVERLWSDKWLDLLKKFVLNSFEIESGYYAERSQLVLSIMKVISKKDSSSYFQELLKKSLDDNDRLMIFRIERGLVAIFNVDDVDFFVEILKESQDRKNHLLRLISILEYSENEQKNEILGLIRQKMPEAFNQIENDRANAERKSQKYRADYNFNKEYNQIFSQDNIISTNALLKVTDRLNRYMSDESNSRETINYTEDQLQEIWLKLKAFVLDTFDPADTELSYDVIEPDKKTYTITRYTQWFELAIHFGHLTNRQDLGNYRQKMISLLPYAYYYGKKAILETLVDLNQTEANKIVALYSDPENTRTYFSPENFIELVKTHSISSAVPVLRKFVYEEKISKYARRDALEIAENLKPSKRFLKDVHEHYSKYSDGASEILNKSNDLLIESYRDDEAIQRNFKFLHDNAFEYVEVGGSGFHEVGLLEGEIHDKTHTKALKSLKEKKYMKNFLDLLTFSFELFERGEKWESYAKYLWDLVDQYFLNLIPDSNYSTLISLENAVNDSITAGSSQYMNHLNHIKGQYLEILGKPKDYRYGIDMLNRFNGESALGITSEEGLYETVTDCLYELERWAKAEGSKLVDGIETETQRNLRIYFENTLYRMGFNAGDFSIQRESQAEDDTRTDFIIHYGFIGPLIVEVKRFEHSDLTGQLNTKKSYESMQKYMKQYRSKYGLFVVYPSKESSKATWDRKIKKIEHEYEKIQGVYVKGLTFNKLDEKPSLTRQS